MASPRPRLTRASATRASAGTGLRELTRGAGACRLAVAAGLAVAIDRGDPVRGLLVAAGWLAGLLAVALVVGE